VRSWVCFNFADGHNVDPVNIGRLLFHVRLDAPDKCGDPGVGEENGPHSVPVGRWDRLAEQEVVVALDEAKADADEHQCDKHRFRSLSL